MRKVLIISYHFPPVNNIAARRFGQMVKYMPQFNWQPFVLTTKSEGALPILMPKEHILRIGENYDSNKVLVSEEGYRGMSLILKIFYFFYKKFGMEIFSIDRFFFSWKKEVLKNINKIKAMNPDIILATFDPAASLWLGHILSKKLGKPWIADFRDPCSLNNQSKFPFMKALDQKIDKWLINTASMVTAFSKSAATLMGNFYQKPARVLFNGFEETEFIPSNNQPGKKEKKILYYAGRFHFHRIPAVKLLIDWLASERDNIWYLKIRSLGHSKANEEILNYAQRRGAISRIEILEPSSPEIVKKEEKESDVLLLFEGLQEKLPLPNLTGKLFEYLCQRKPILAVCRKDSEIGEILGETNRGYLASNTFQLETIMKKIREGEELIPNLQEVQKYSRKSQCKILCELLDNIILNKKL